MSNNKILSFCLGEEDGTAIFCETREEFLQCINEKIDEAEARGQEHFDMIIEKTECQGGENDGKNGSGFIS